MLAYNFVGFVSGGYVGFGGLLSTIAGGGLFHANSTDPHYDYSPGVLAPGLVKLAVGATFPVALFLIVIVGGDLFTGNCMYMVVGWFLFQNVCSAHIQGLL